MTEVKQAEIKQAEKPPLVWRVTGETVPGASHLRSGTPNQDSILQMRESGTTLPLVLNVSDGHGSDKCFRSDRGSHFAVHVAAMLVREFLHRNEGVADPTEIEKRAKEFLPGEFVQRWRADVEEDLKREPFTEAEFKKLVEKDGERARKLVEANPPLAYGATTLTVLLTDTFILYLQLGDGEILTVSDKGEVKLPLPPDERLFANETTSLSLEKAASDFRVMVQDVSNEPPALILMTTDGYANSFSDDEGFFKVGSDVLEMMRAEGFDSVGASVKAWIEEATRVGSGDDCTLGIICRMDALKKQASASEPPETVKAEVGLPPATAQSAPPDTGAANNEMQPSLNPASHATPDEGAPKDSHTAVQQQSGE